jgi:hypothetical protein
MEKFDDAVKQIAEIGRPTKDDLNQVLAGISDKEIYQQQFYFVYGLLTMRRAIEFYYGDLEGEKKSDVAEKIMAVRRDERVTSIDVFSKYFAGFSREDLEDDLAFTLPADLKKYAMYKEGIDYQVDDVDKNSIKMKMFRLAFRGLSATAMSRAIRILKTAIPKRVKMGMPRINHRILREKALRPGDDRQGGYEGHRAFLKKRERMCFDA